MHEKIWAEASAEVQLIERFRFFQKVSRGIDVSSGLGSHFQFRDPEPLFPGSTPIGDLERRIRVRAILIGLDTLIERLGQVNSLLHLSMLSALPATGVQFARGGKRDCSFFVL